MTNLMTLTNFECALQSMLVRHVLDNIDLERGPAVIKVGRRKFCLTKTFLKCLACAHKSRATTLKIYDEDFVVP